MNDKLKSKCDGQMTKGRRLKTTSILSSGSRQPGVLLQRGRQPCAGRLLCRYHPGCSVPGGLRDDDDVDGDGSDGDDGDDDVDDKDL